MRRWLAKQGFTGDGDIPEIPDEIRIEATRRYSEAVEQITGEAFVPDLDEPIARMRRNLGLGRSISGLSRRRGSGGARPDCAR